MKRVLVIVVTYNGMQWLQRCLDSVVADADLYVFDNASTDGSADYVESHYPQALLVRSAVNLGFSKPNNLGMRYALEKGYEYVYLLNQDAWLEPGALEKLVCKASLHPEYGLLSPLQMTDGYKGLDAQFEKILRGSAPQDANGIIPVKRVMAAHWLVPLSSVRKVGLFNEDLFPHWGQDDDWCQRLDYSGLRIGVVPGARAVHDRARREESVEKRVKRDYYTGSLLRLVNPRKNFLFQLAFVLVFTFVKAVKYRSLLPFKYLGEILKSLSRIRFFRMSQK